MNRNPLQSAAIATATAAAMALCAAVAVTEPDVLDAQRPAKAPPTSVSSAVLTMLPDGEEKRRFVTDCTGCHQLTPANVFPSGRARTADEWATVVANMQSFAGHDTGFPIIGMRDPDATGAWLARHFRGDVPGAVKPSPHARAVITEFAYPYVRDLPHDLDITSDGRVVITGMMTHRMLVLDPSSGTYDEIAIPVERANPRALEIDDDGNWWVVLGSPNMLARYEPARAQWKTWNIGMYAHEARPDNRGRVWFNGHFTSAPVKVGYLDVASDNLRMFDVPTPTALATAGTIPYGLAIAPDGKLWGSDLRASRIYSVDAASGAVVLYDMPTPYSAPRRIDFDATGKLWMPEYAHNVLTSFDPATGSFEQFAVPIPDALPYVARVDERRGIVWLGTGAADAILAFDMKTRAFDVFPLPTEGALVRHIALDERSGDLWIAYGASPGIPPKIARLRLTP